MFSLAARQARCFIPLRRLSAKPITPVTDHRGRELCATERVRYDFLQTQIDVLAEKVNKLEERVITLSTAPPPKPTTAEWAAVTITGCLIVALPVAIAVI